MIMKPYHVFTAKLTTVQSHTNNCVKLFQCYYTHEFVYIFCRPSFCVKCKSTVWLARLLNQFLTEGYNRLEEIFGLWRVGPEELYCVKYWKGNRTNWPVKTGTFKYITKNSHSLTVTQPFKYKITVRFTYQRDNTEMWLCFPQSLPNPFYYIRQPPLYKKNYQIKTSLHGQPIPILTLNFHFLSLWREG
jgi:hypothetical protein